MRDYIERILRELPERLSNDKTATTPAAEHLFNVRSEAPKLTEEQGLAFHTTVAKLLFFCKHARPDIQTVVSFLCTRVQSADEDDWKKLDKVLRYLRGTLDRSLHLEAESLHIFKWWVDASYAVHPDMRSHIGTSMSLGRGVAFGMSSRHKLNTRSSTEAELVGVDDCMPHILWTRYFMEEQGYPPHETSVYQDNKSAILLESNGRASSGRRTRHINVRYYFVSDRIQKGELSVGHCGTKEMVADFFTKPLQG